MGILTNLTILVNILTILVTPGDYPEEHGDRDHRGPNLTILYVTILYTIPDPTGPHHTKGDHTGLYRTIRNHTGPYGTIRDHAEPYGVILDQTGPYKTILDHTGPYKTIRFHEGS